MPKFSRATAAIHESRKAISPSGCS